MACVVDPTDATSTFWVTPRGSHPTSGATFPWVEYNDLVKGPIGGAFETEGVLVDIPANGRDRLYVQVSGVTGTGDVATASFTIAYKPTCLIGPYTLEGI